MTHLRIVRPRLDWFVDQMRTKLAIPKNQRKADWRGDPYPVLRTRVEAELVELDKTLVDLQGTAVTAIGLRKAMALKLIKECADTANMLMMLADAAAEQEGTRFDGEVGA